MSTTITIAGKGGTGKTTIAALLIKLLSRRGAVLAIDADPSTNLNYALGLPLRETVGRVREKMSEEAKWGGGSPGVSKQDLVELKIRQALVESEGVDLLAMGRPEGPGCYCAANNWLRSAIDRLAGNYQWVVIDSEAGMEHVSRQTTRDVDFLLIISDPTMRGVLTAAGMKELISELRTKVGKIYLIVNRAANGLPPPIRKAIEEAGLEILVTIPEDRQLADLEAKARPVIELPPDSPLQLGVREIVSKIGL